MHTTQYTLEFWNVCAVKISIFLEFNEKLNDFTMAQEKTTSNPPANVEVDTSVGYPSIAVYECALLTGVAQYENDASYGDELYVM